MHTAKLFPAQFSLEVGGRVEPFDALFPGWHDYDRFGIVATSTLGPLGASLLIAAATACHFEAKPQRRTDAHGSYPEIYLFHVGGRHGDHSYFDFWPPRKEVFLEPSSPVHVLEAINSHAITRLAVPDGPAGPLAPLGWGPSTWAERHAALDRIASCFAYEPGGHVDAPEIVLRSSAPEPEENAGASFDPLSYVDFVLNMPHEEFMATLPGPSLPDDNYRWAEIVRSRRHEVPKDVLAQLAAERQLSIAQANGVRVESFRRLSTDAALQIIAAWD
jgi:hypothetical protein